MTAKSHTSSTCQRSTPIRSNVVCKATANKDQTTKGFGFCCRIRTRRTSGSCDAAANSNGCRCATSHRSSVDVCDEQDFRVRAGKEQCEIALGPLIVRRAAENRNNELSEQRSTTTTRSPRDAPTAARASLRRRSLMSKAKNHNDEGNKNKRDSITGVLAHDALADSRGCRRRRIVVLQQISAKCAYQKTACASLSAFQQHTDNASKRNLQRAQPIRRSARAPHSMASAAARDRRDALRRRAPVRSSIDTHSARRFP